MHKNKGRKRKYLKVIRRLTNTRKQSDTKKADQINETTLSSSTFKLLNVLNCLMCSTDKKKDNIHTKSICITYFH